MNLKISVIAVLLFGQILAGSSMAFCASDAGFYSSVPAAYMEDPRRIEWQKPEKVVEHLLIKQGDVIADIGAGTGYFSVLFAQKVGKDGIVYAVDVDKSMVDYVAKRVNKAGLKNIRGILSTPDDPLLPKASIDLIFICDTYLFFEDRVQYLSRLRDCLKKGGRLAIVSFNPKAEIPGAPPQHKMIPREKTVLEAEKAGFTLAAEYFFLPYHDFLVFGKK